MTCPACGSKLKEHTTGKGTKFLTCARFPKCRISGTPELLDRLKPPATKEPIHIGIFVTGVAQLAIHRSRLKAAKTKEEREAIRNSALEAFK